MLCLAGYVPSVGRRQSFKGWRFIDDYIYTPEGDKFTAADIRGIKLLYEQLRDHRVQIRQLNKKIEQLKENQKPAPASNVVQFPTRKIL
jgi:hypothetical protein